MTNNPTPLTETDLKAILQHRYPNAKIKRANVVNPAGQITFVVTAVSSGPLAVGESLMIRMSTLPSPPLSMEEIGRQAEARFKEDLRNRLSTLIEDIGAAHCPIFSGHKVMSELNRIVDDMNMEQRKS